MVSLPAILALTITFTVQSASKAVSCASKAEVCATTPSLPTSEPDSLLSEKKMDSRMKSRNTSMITFFRCKSSRGSSAADVWSIVESLKQSGGSRLQVRAADEENVSNLPILLLMNTHSLNVLRFQTYCIMNNLQKYDSKVASRTGKYAKRMDSVMRPCIIDGRSSITILRILDQFKRLDDSNIVSEGMPLWILLSFIEKGPCASFNSLPLPIGIRKDVYMQPGKNDYKTRTYVEAVEHPLKFYATIANIAKATSKMGQIVKLTNDSAVQF